ncbi:MAG: hypothetical protein HZC49_08085 [Nitrospirae bacterium]|nr:hypothetical protein [Nitrospirota bacterium]
MKKVFVLFSVLMLCAVFTACGSGGGSGSSTSQGSTDATLANTWKLISENGAEPDWVEILSLNADNNYSISATFSDGSTCTLTGTYTASGNTVTSNATGTSNSSLCPITNSTISFTYSISGNNMTLTGSDNTISVYQKQ